MSGASPPKPWERAGAGGTSASAIPSSTTTATATAATPSTTSTSSAPSLPARPTSLNTIASQTASNYSSPYGYGGATGMNSYNRGYGGSMYGSSMGGYGGGMYGSSMGGMYGNSMGMGGYGGGMYGNSMGMGGYGRPGAYGPQGQEPSLSQTVGQSTQQAFQMVESFIGAIGGFTQMLEGSYMATHSSFFAMVSIAEQLGNFRDSIGGGFMAVFRWIRTLLCKITGRPPPASSTELTPANFAGFTGNAPPGGEGAAAGPPRTSKKPLVLFLLFVFGLPYLMRKLIKSLAASNEAEQQRLMAANPYAAAEQGAPIDPSKLDFCKVLYDYSPQLQPGQQATEGMDLEVKAGDLVAVIGKTDPMGAPSEWWRCRARDGRMGYLPSPYLEVIQRKAQGQLRGPQSAEGSPAGSRVNTMTGSGSGGSRVNSMTKVEREKQAVVAAEKEKPELPVGKGGDVSVESFQKGGFYS